MIVKRQTQPDWKLKKNVKTTEKLENYMFMKDEMFKQNNKPNVVSDIALEGQLP